MEWPLSILINYGFLSFMAGPRGCIGNVFAKVEFKHLLAAVIEGSSLSRMGRGRWLLRRD